MMVRRWGVLWRRLEVDYERWSFVLRVCAKMHNLCVDDAVPRPFQADTVGTVREVPEFDPVVNDDDDDDEGLNHDGGRRGQPGRRTEITKVLEERGVKRPRYAEANSRA